MRRKEIGVYPPDDIEAVVAMMNWRFEYSGKTDPVHALGTKWLSRKRAPYEMVSQNLSIFEGLLTETRKQAERREIKRILRAIGQALFDYFIEMSEPVGYRKSYL